jgi:hypothetical protein
MYNCVLTGKLKQFIRPKYCDEWFPVMVGSGVIPQTEGAEYDIVDAAQKELGGSVIQQWKKGTMR